MDWLNTIMPTAATLLGSPALGVAVKFLAGKLGVEQATVDTVQTALTTLNETPEGRIKMAQIDAELKTHAMDIGLETERIALSALEAINKTMQAEAASEHWPTYSWRPFCGFVFGVMFLGVYFVLPLLHQPVPVVPSEAWIAIGGVLGVASWFRGKAQADPSIPTSNKG
jgi:hypothetical protein